jgi:hypothetical protein
LDVARVDDAQLGSDLEVSKCLLARLDADGRDFSSLTGLEHAHRIGRRFGETI